MLLRHEAAWQTLPFATRSKLYALLPAPLEGEAPRDLDVSPLDTDLKQYIEGAFRQYQDDLKEGRETRKWRSEALEAGEMRRKGEFDAVKEAEREKWFGQIEGKGNEVEGESHNDGKFESET